MKKVRTSDEIQSEINRLEWELKELREELYISDAVNNPNYQEYKGKWVFHDAYESGRQLFGHVHSGPGADGLDISRLRVLLPTQYDVGVDNNNFTPISYREVKNKIEAQKNESLDRAKA